MRPDSVGVWLELPPGANLRGEGIPRVLASLIRAAHRRQGTRIVVATPRWMRKEVLAFLAELDVPPEAADVVVARHWAEGIATALSAGRRTVVRCVPKIVRKVLAGPAFLLGRLLPRSKQVLYQEVLKLEYRRLARAASRRRDVAVWFVPHPAWRGATALGRPLVVAVPDLVYAEFPDGFDPTWRRNVDTAIRELTSAAAATISYSDYVRDRHVVGHLGVETARAHTIRHGPIEVARHLPAGALMDGEAGRRVAIAVLDRWLSGRGAGDADTGPTLRSAATCRFAERRFLFVSSQIRPYKGYVPLVRAFARLHRGQHRDLDLVVTGDIGSRSAPGAADDVRREIVAEGLEGAVVDLPGVPPSAHAALYRLAALTVMPSLFEGGFPFQFSESLSVGTPIVMSAIPVVLDTLPKPLAELTVFDPADPVSMAARIDWALDHAGQLLEAQREFFATLRQRAWEDVADEYLAVFAEAAASVKPSRAVAGPDLPCRPHRADDDGRGAAARS